jgi:hypothetical protein
VRFEVVPIGRREADDFIRRHHRTHRPIAHSGHRFVLGIAEAGSVVGVAVCGRPVARYLDDGWTVEVGRACTDGTRHANSALYGACWRAAVALGYRRLITYTLPEEGGASLRAAGFRLVGAAGGGTWNRRERPRVDRAPLQEKLLWEQCS